MEMTKLIPEPEFLEAPEKLLVALSCDFDQKTRVKIPELWNDFWSREWDLPGKQEQACYGASYASHPDGRFSYAAGLSIEPMPEQMPQGSCVITLSAGRYAVFRKRGAVQEIPKLFDAIFTHWLENSGEKQRAGCVFERYPFEDGGSPDSMAYEIWVPVAS